MYDVVGHIGEDKCVNTKFKDGFTTKHVDETINKLLAQMETTTLEKKL